MVAYGYPGWLHMVWLACCLREDVNGWLFLPLPHPLLHLVKLAAKTGKQDWQE